MSSFNCWGVMPVGTCSMFLCYLNFWWSISKELLNSRNYFYFLFLVCLNFHEVLSQKGAILLLGRWDGTAHIREMRCDCFRVDHFCFPQCFLLINISMSSGLGLLYCVFPEDGPAGLSCLSENAVFYWTGVWFMLWKQKVLERLHFKKKKKIYSSPMENVNV